MANPPLPKKWEDKKVVPPMATSQDQVQDLAELAKATNNVAGHRLVKLLKKEYNAWLEFVARGDKSGTAKIAPKVIALFNATVDSIESKAGGGSGEPPCGSPFGNPCEAPDKEKQINLEELARKVYLRLIFDARVERERLGWPS